MRDDQRSWQERLLAGEHYTSLLNEPIDFNVTFAVEQPKRESATERAMRIWFKQNPRREPT